MNTAFEELQGRKRDFDAKAVKELLQLLQGSMETQMTLLRLFDRMIEERKSRIGIDVSPTSMSTWHYARLTLGDFVKKKYKMNDIAFGALNEQFIREYQAYTEGERGYFQPDHTALPRPAEEGLPDSLQGGLVGGVALRAFQAAQAERKHAEGVEPGGLREAAGCGDTGEKTFRRHHEGPVPVRVLYGNSLCGHRVGDTGEPVHGRRGQPVAEIPAQEERTESPRKAAAGGRRPDREV